MSHYSIFNLLRHALTGHRGWQKTWQKNQLKPHYDVVIVGAGGHGLATAYYLATRHGVGNIAVIEKGYLGGGNSGRNTQVCRSNYFYPASSAFYEHSLQMYETLSHDLNFNTMMSQRGVLSLCNDPHELELGRRWANAMKMNGVDSRMMSRSEIQTLLPLLNMDGRFPITGGFIQDRGGITRHDAVVWAYARAASKAGVDIIEQCEVTGISRKGNQVVRLETSEGGVTANHYALCVAGHSSHLARTAGLELPISSVALQAMVSEPLKPIVPTTLMAAKVHAYVSQSDRGELVMGGGVDGYSSYAQRGGLPTLKDNVKAIIELFPSFSRLRLMRQWAGICDMAPDVTPVIGKTPLSNLFISTGWGTGGYKAIPAGGETLAATIATGKTHALIRPFSLARFDRGALIDEGAASGVAH